MRFKRGFKRTISLLLCVIMLTLVASYTPAVTVNVSAKKTAAELKEELAAAQKESNKLKSQISELEKANAPYQEKKEALQKQIDATQKEIDLYQEQIDVYDAEIAVFQNEIDKLNEQIDENLDLFAERLVVLYTTGSYTELEVLLSAKDFGEYLEKAQLTKSMSEYDNQLLADLTADIAEVEEKKAVIDEDKQVIVNAQNAIQEKQAELDRQYTEVATIVKNYENDIAELQDSYEDMLDEQKEIEKALQEITGSVVGTGRFTWPVPGYYKLSSKYGYRWHPVTGTWKLHTGIDISSSGIYGARIVAADDGTVSLSGWNGGYGWCVVINHGNGYSTLYAHMKAASSLKKGQAVTKGSTVGYVGSTGTSTGPHLHFEIRQNGSPKDPLKWFNL